MSKRKSLEKGERRTIWLPRELDEKAEQARKTLGLGRSGFYRYAVTEVVKDLVIAAVGFDSNKKAMEATVGASTSIAHDKPTTLSCGGNTNEF